ncbi:Succinate dehydrogenase assembly factor 1A, mitochondrial [Porphyridium purpureum]|uniref:Succinate dehydrogenase assembly factor 1A, mitochondrial n=1 Tax=Porphyridium purpureum TaxID=35688 RepID=A0A5J4YL25_PORPP|nr:Succinate dehydrogenase assembly factor 1A, mitochondrial [Porphyridium purpureum]|eukprot:POR3892..scf244_11
MVKASVLQCWIRLNKSWFDLLWHRDCTNAPATGEMFSDGWQHQRAVYKHGHLQRDAEKFELVAESPARVEGHKVRLVHFGRASTLLIDHSGRHIRRILIQPCLPVVRCRFVELGVTPRVAAFANLQHRTERCREEHGVRNDPHPPATMMRKTGLQTRVLSLYRAFLREARRLDGGARERYEQHVRSQFRSDAQRMAKSSVDRIEYVLRVGYKKLELVKTPGFRGLGE